MKTADTRRFVLDASVAIAWCFPDEHSPDIESLLDLLSDGCEAIVPTLWPLEVANALLAGERKKRITLVQVTSMLKRIAALPIVLEPMGMEKAFEQVLPLARQQDLTEYDSAYLELAIREGLPLATLDEKLRRAATICGVATIGI